MAKWVYGFGAGKAEGRADMKNLLGGKGANLAEMSNLGLPVPPGFTISTELCTHYYASGQTYPADLRLQVEAALEAIEKVVEMRFGDPTILRAGRQVLDQGEVGDRAQRRADLAQ